MKFSQHLNDFFSLFYPNNCRVCGRALFKGEAVICLLCQLHLPKTDFHLMPENAVSKNFWGQVNLEAATAMYYFHKGEKVQKLIHDLKYRGRKEVGIKLGKLFASELLKSECFSTCDVIVPVPLHKNKERLRGFNQSTVIGEGMAEILNKPLKPDLLKRVKANETQTKKMRYARFENTNEIFVLNEKDVPFKKFLLIDDVITTGSTIAACADALLQLPDAKVCVGALAFSHR